MVVRMSNEYNSSDTDKRVRREEDLRHYNSRKKEQKDTGNDETGCLFEHDDQLWQHKLKNNWVRVIA